MTQVRIVFAENGVESEVWLESDTDWFFDKELETEFFMEHPTAEIVEINHFD